MLLAREFAQWQVLQAGSLAEALEHLDRQADIALVLLDLGLPDSDGLAGLHRLRTHAAGPRYVVMSSSDDEKTILAAIEHGAAGFIRKTSRAGAMLDALRTVMGGGVFLPPCMGGVFLESDAVGGASACEVLAISPRQLDVLRLLVEGKSNKAICRDLGIAESIVKTHLVTIFRPRAAFFRALSRALGAVMVVEIGLLKSLLLGRPACAPVEMRACSQKVTGNFSDASLMP